MFLQVISCELDKATWLFPGYNTLLAKYSSLASLAPSAKDTSQSSLRPSHLATSNENGEAGAGAAQATTPAANAA